MKRATVSALVATVCMVAGCSGANEPGGPPAAHGQSVQAQQARGDWITETKTEPGPARTEGASGRGPRMRACWRRPVVLQAGPAQVTMRRRPGPVLTLRPGETAALAVAPRCRAAVSLSVNDVTVVGNLQRGAVLAARAPGRTQVSVIIAMCAQVTDPACIGGVTFLGHARIHVLPATHGASPAA
jgi:hypothetical protein